MESPCAAAGDLVAGLFSALSPVPGPVGVVATRAFPRRHPQA